MESLRRLLVEEDGGGVNAVTVNAVTALHLAAALNRIDGADIDA